MSTETVQCGKREYTLECQITKNGHRFLMITERSFGRMSKVMVFQDHYQAFREALDRVCQSAPGPAGEADGSCPREASPLGAAPAEVPQPTLS
ncbi:MAG: hypothetical protein IPP68_03360 [Elusimicrobia bacterium]|nr:hypothetical protein [Elusimicrobiota bacterium]